MTENRPIVEIINEYLAGNTTEIPIFHPVALKLQRVLAKPDYTIEEVSQLITADPSLTTQVLRVANSAFYMGLSKVTTIRDAVIRLGAREVSNIVMVATQQQLYRSTDTLFNRAMQTLWKHAFCTAIGTKWIAFKSGYASLAHEAFLAGLLHDVGMLYLLKVLEEISGAGKLNSPLTQGLLSEIFANMHVEQGYILMTKWNMPEVFCEVVRDHHLPEWKQSNPVLTMVRLSDKVCNKLGIGIHPEPSLVPVDTTEASILGLKDIALSELEVVIEDAIKIALQGRN